MATATHQYDALDLFQHMVNNVFQPHAFDTSRSTPNNTEYERQESRLVRMDVSETEQAYLIAAEFPGVKKEEVNVTIEGKQVILQAETQRAKAEEGDDAPRSLLSERFHGKMSRRIKFQQEIDEENASAKFVDGILHLTLPKKKLITAKRLSIQ